MEQEAAGRVVVYPELKKQIAEEAILLQVPCRSIALHIKVNAVQAHVVQIYRSKRCISCVIDGEIDW